MVTESKIVSLTELIKKELSIFINQKVSDIRIIMEIYTEDQSIISGILNPFLIICFRFNV
jgi:hypothetical protein